MKIVFRSKRYVVKLYFDANNILEHAFALDREGLVPLMPSGKPVEVWTCIDIDISTFDRDVDGFLDYWSQVLPQLEDVDVVVE